MESRVHTINIGGKALAALHYRFAEANFPPCWSGGREAEGGGLLNRYRGEIPYRGFESLPLRLPDHACSV